MEWSEQPKSRQVLAILSLSRIHIRLLLLDMTTHFANRRFRIDSLRMYLRGLALEISLYGGVEGSGAASDAKYQRQAHLFNGEIPLLRA